MSRRTLPFACAIVATAIACGWSVNALADFAIYTVGGDAACGYASIQAAVDAAAAHPGEDYVWIASNRSYTGQNIQVTNQDVNIEGGFTDCSDVDIDTARTTISGAGNNGSAVFTIRGDSHVLLRNVLIRGAERDGDASGGGVDFAGSGQLSVEYATVTQNTAGYGGGINFKASGGTAALMLGVDTLILANTASTSGGGIRLEGPARMYALADDILIGYNHALDGYGGGVEVIGPAQADIGSPGYNGSPVIQFNQAQYGGGISVSGGQDRDEDALVRLFATDPQHPVQVSGNIAAHTGGGIYVEPTTGLDTDGYYFSTSVLCAFDFRIDDNIAQEGTALYSDTTTWNLGLEDVGGFVHLTTRYTECAAPESVEALGAVACARGVACNTMNGNTAQDSTAQPTPGSTLLIQNGGILNVYGLRMQDNLGAHGLHLFDAYSDIQNCLLTDNVYDSELISIEYGRDDQNAVFRGCTFAGNSLGGTGVIHSGQNLFVFNSLIAQPGMASVHLSSATLTVGNIVASDTTGLPTQSGVVEGNPTFVDAVARNYHLQMQSLGVDFAPAGGGTDIDRQGHDIDLGQVPNVYGVRDLGVYEIQLGCARADTVYCDGFDIE